MSYESFKSCTYNIRSVRILVNDWRLNKPYPINPITNENHSKPASRFFLTTAVFSQEYRTQVKPVDSKTWGYANEKGEMVIKPQFEKCHKFSSDGLAAIYDTKAKQYYFINAKGEKINTEVTDFKLIDRFGFDLEGFNNGLIPIRQGEKWGYLNVEGKLAIPAKYEHVTGFSDNHAIATLNKNFIVLNTSGEEPRRGFRGFGCKGIFRRPGTCKSLRQEIWYIDTKEKLLWNLSWKRGLFCWWTRVGKTSDDKVGYVTRPVNGLSNRIFGWERIWFFQRIGKSQELATPGDMLIERRSYEGLTPNHGVICRRPCRGKKGR